MEHPLFPAACYPENKNLKLKQLNTLKPMTGKIARLPHQIREEINRRLQDGEPGRLLLAWLNALPQTLCLLANQFSDFPFSIFTLKTASFAFVAANQPKPASNSPTRNGTGNSNRPPLKDNP